MAEPDNLRYLREKVDEVEQRMQLESKGGPPYDGGMDARVSKLEATLPYLATKGDVADTRTAVSEAKSDIIKWLSTIIIATAAAIISVTAFMLNRIPFPAPQATQAPIVIYAPPQAPPAQPRKP